MKLPSLSSLVSGLAAALAAILVASCGGGGASGNPSQPGGATLAINPAQSTIYAGVPTEFHIIGGRQPYLLTSSEPTILPVPSSISSSSVTLLPNNPGVIDAGLPAGSLPIRTITVSVNSADGLATTATVHVAQNFLTGYGATFSGSACPANAQLPATGTGNAVCAGGETTVRFAATTNGTLHGDEAFTLTVLQGNAVVVDPATGANGQSVTINSDHTGTVTALLRAAPNQPTQLGILRIQEASTGVYMDTVFVIAGNSSTTALTAIPTTFTFTGATTDECGTGSGTIQVFDGVPPYMASSSNSALATVTPSTSGSQPGVFVVSAGNRDLCGNTSIVISDSTGARTTVTVTTAAGTVAPPTPPVPILISPNPITLSCGSTSSVSIAGGASTTYSASTTDPNLLVTVTGNTLSVTRATPGGTAAGTVTSAVTVTDGASFATLSVKNPGTC